MRTNQLILSGTVCKISSQVISPSGISHYQFLLEHASMRREAGFIRRIWCKVPVVISRKYLSYSNDISLGIQVSVHGFICSHKRNNGLSKIILHAEKINLITIKEI